MGNIKTNLEKNMAELFDLPSEKEPEKIVEVKKETDNLLDSDFDKSRNGLDSLLSTGQEALQYALSVAKQSDDPKAYEVVSNMIKNLADINEQLLNLHLKHQRHNINSNAPRKEQNLNTVPGVPQLTTNNAFFVGTAAELAKMIKMNSGETIHDVTD